MENQHRHIAGYRELTREEIDLMNRIKAAGAELLQLQAELAGRLSTDHECKRASALASKMAPEDEGSDECVELRRFERAVLKLKANLEVPAGTSQSALVVEYRKPA